MTSIWDHPEVTDDAIIERALGYPYDLPSASYVFSDGVPKACNPDDADALRQQRTPVLAVGSNQSPVQMARKYDNSRAWSPIFCEQCRLAGFDTVYSAHIAAYGSIAATLHPSPGTRVSLFVNWLDDAQLERMHKTELGSGNYAFARLADVEIRTDLGFRLDTVHFYSGNRGALRHDNAPVPLASVRAEGRAFRPMTQAEIQAVARGRTAPGSDERSFILSSVGDAAARTSRRDALMADAFRFNHPGLEILLE